MAGGFFLRDSKFTVSRRFTYQGHLLTCFGLGGVICHWRGLLLSICPWLGGFSYEIQCSRTLDVPFLLRRYIKLHSISGVLFALAGVIIGFSGSYFPRDSMFTGFKRFTYLSIEEGAC